jgi:hypothetical protein
LYGSACKYVQNGPIGDEQAVSNCGQPPSDEVEHCPIKQLEPGAHVTPQPPQFIGSFCGLTQVGPIGVWHTMFGGAQLWHWPITQVVPIPQVMPQPPQFNASFCALTHVGPIGVGHAMLGGGQPP